MDIRFLLTSFWQREDPSSFYPFSISGAVGCVIATALPSAV